jgi:prepilin-type N-terminal cleavage/methylation domain-containing protein
MPSHSLTHRSAFSLVELLTVMAIIVILAALAVPAMNAIKGGSDLTKSASDLSDLVQQARTYAMANNTYVYLGLEEVDPMQNGYVASANGGRVITAVVSSKTGLRPTADPSTPGPLTTTDIQPISRLQKFDNLHLATSGDMGNSGGMAKRVTDVVDLGSGDAVTSFSWPVEGGGTSSTLKKVIEFDPQGVARVQDGQAAPESINGWIEIPLQPSKGNAGVAANEKNAAALQVDGMTGAVQIYRP